MSKTLGDLSRAASQGEWSPGHLGDETTKCDCRSVVTDQMLVGQGPLVMMTIEDAEKRLQDDEVAKLKEELKEAREEILRFRALIAEIDRRTMFEAHGMGNTFADSIDCLVMCGGRCPTVEEAYSGALRCEKHA